MIELTIKCASVPGKWTDRKVFDYDTNKYKKWLLMNRQNANNVVQYLCGIMKE